MRFVVCPLFRGQRLCGRAHCLEDQDLCVAIVVGLPPMGRRCLSDTGLVMAYAPSMMFRDRVPHSVLMHVIACPWEFLCEALGLD